MFKKILLVDDDESCNFLSETILQDMDAAKEIEVAEDGLVACSLMEKGTCPDIIFLDIRMPRMDGFDFLEKLNKMKVCDSSKIFMLTSSPRQEDREKAFQYKNVLEYLEKPLTEQVVRRISTEYFSG